MRLKYLLQRTSHVSPQRNWGTPLICTFVYWMQYLLAPLCTHWRSQGIWCQHVGPEWCESTCRKSCTYFFSQSRRTSSIIRPASWHDLRSKPLCRYVPLFASCEPDCANTRVPKKTSSYLLQFHCKLVQNNGKLARLAPGRVCPRWKKLPCMACP